MNKVIQDYQDQKYFSCLRRLKKIYRRNPFRLDCYVFFAFCYLKTKKFSKAILWFRQAFHQFPENTQAAELYAYFTVVLKKNPDEALIPLARLTQINSDSGLTDYILSRYYEKKKDLERACFFSRQAWIKNPAQIPFQRRLILLLKRLKGQEELDEFAENPYYQRISRSLDYSKKTKDQLHSLEKIEILKKKGILILDKSTLHSPLFQFWFFKHYREFLPETDPLVKIQALKTQGIDFFQNLSGKKQKKQPLFDENLARIIGWVILTGVILSLLKGLL